MDEDNGKKWVMPEPVFRHSTGELVTPAEGIYFDPEPDTLEPNLQDESEVETGEFTLPEFPPTAAATTPPAGNPLAQLYDPPPKPAPPSEAAQPTPAPPVAVEPQPFVSEEFTAEKIVVPGSPVKPKQSGGSMIVVVGALVLLGVAAAVGLLIYYLYYAGRTETGF